MLHNISKLCMILTRPCDKIIPIVFCNRVWSFWKGKHECKRGQGGGGAEKKTERGKLKRDVGGGGLRRLPEEEAQRIRGKIVQVWGKRGKDWQERGMRGIEGRKTKLPRNWGAWNSENFVIRGK